MQVRVHNEGKLRREPGGQNWKQSPRGACSLTCSRPVVSYLSYRIQYHLPRAGTTYSELGPSTSVINQENASQTSLQAISWSHFLNYHFLFPKNLSLCQERPLETQGFSIKYHLPPPTTVCVSELKWFFLFYHKALNSLAYASGN